MLPPKSTAAAAPATSDGLCVTNDCDDTTPSLGTTVFGQSITVTSDTLSWGVAMNVRWCKGDLSGIGSYATTGEGSLYGATSLDLSADVPSPGGGIYYIVREQGGGSWQTSLGNEPDRDADLPLP